MWRLSQLRCTRRVLNLTRLYWTNVGGGVWNPSTDKPQTANWIRKQSHLLSTPAWNISIDKLSCLPGSDSTSKFCLHFLLPNHYLQCKYKYLQKACSSCSHTLCCCCFTQRLPRLNIMDWVSIKLTVQKLDR